MHTPDMTGTPQDKQLTKYRGDVLLQNIASHLRVLSGLAGLFAFFVLALLSIVDGAEAGLFAGGLWAVLKRFVYFGFWLACLWGLFQAWIDFAERSDLERRYRSETLARIEQDPSWWERWEST